MLQRRHGQEHRSLTSGQNVFGRQPKLTNPVEVESLPFTMAPVFIGNLFVTVSKNYKVLNQLLGIVAANPATAERRTLPKIKLSYLLSNFSSNRQRWAIR
jgi:hypothetical protein